MTPPSAAIDGEVSRACRPPAVRVIWNALASQKWLERVTSVTYGSRMKASTSNPFSPIGRIEATVPTCTPCV